MKNILLTNHYSDEPYSIIKQCLPSGFKLIMLENISQNCLLSKAAEADYVLASGRLKIDKEFLDKATKIKMIQRTGVGLDSLDLQEIKKRKIPFFVNQGVNSQSVAEHTILLILASLRKLTQIHNNTINGIWEKQKQGITTNELKGKTIGIVGMGNIAKKVVNILNAFDVKIIYYDLYRLSEKQEKALKINYCDYEDMLPQIDILTLHCPLTDSTKHIVNFNSLSKMKKNVIIINTARGSLIESEAIYNYLCNNTKAFAALDVHETEPLIDSPLTKLSNIILTPHIGGITYDSFNKMMNEAMRNIRLFDEEKYQEIEEYRLKL